ncbi:MAG: hypothetical protein HKO59_12205 [Phycisphaerales bacterium]|nr:hypothetical protein [Phycisphaerae bacterium]NNF42638.1 hypothetical protein [Phycisphaerales bacterium]NNM26725.1 hypothetical protein [Phycisphaerales bacterium]
MRRLWVNSETSRLRQVIIGNPERFELAGPINPKLERLALGAGDLPTQETLIPEFAALRAALESRGVEVMQPSPLDGVPDQLTPRDIGFVVGDRFVIANMLTPCRREEWRGIESILSTMSPERIVRPPADVTLEGGDVVLDRGVLYVGLSERTSSGGAAFLAETFGDEYEVVPVPLRTTAEGEDVLHLDCAFVPVGERSAIIYPPGLREIPPRLRAEYDWIEVDREQQHELATNVLSIAPDLVVSRDLSHAVNAEMRNRGIEVIELPFHGTPDCGGSFRCASLPLTRDLQL